RGMRPRRAEQCLPQEGATPKRDAGAPLRVERDRGIPGAAPSFLIEVSARPEICESARISRALHISSFIYPAPFA
ncbi:MAG: hypothetical protein ABIR00_03045, partial [Nitrosospira sp.]